VISPEYLEAVHSHPGLADLALLARAGTGWTFLPVSVDGVHCIYGVREVRTVTETITLRAMDDVTAARLRTEDFQGRRSSSLRGGVLWEYTGTLSDAIDELLALPHPDDPMAPRLLRPASSMLVINGK
jgi:hypothetical protein